MLARPSTDGIWTRLNTDLLGFIRRRVTDDHVADDLLQETFVRVHRNLPALQESDRVAGWVYQIARNVIHDHHRQSSRATVALGDDVAEEADQQNYLRCQGVEWLHEMIQQLPDGYREAIQLSEIEGIAQHEVAARLGLSVSGAKSRIQRGRVMLKEALERCCHFEFDQRGNLLDYIPKPERKVCRNCDE